MVHSFILPEKVTREVFVNAVSKVRKGLQKGLTACVPKRLLGNKCKCHNKRTIELLLNEEGRVVTNCPCRKVLDEAEQPDLSAAGHK